MIHRPAVVTSVAALVTLGAPHAVSALQETSDVPQQVEVLELAAAVESPPDTPPQHDLDDVAALGAWLDGYMASQLKALPTAGATVAVVKDGEVLIARGYGLADVEDDAEVTASTLFRIGSVSKLFTWTAVMQLVERGLLHLDTDISEYMSDVEVPATFEQPITMAHLLTHTPGFEDHVVGLFGDEASDLRSFAEILNEEMPRRVRPPGEVASYSNHGTGMAAYIVEELSGMSFADYMQENILDPLGMTETTIVQPIPSHLVDLMSTGYSDAGNGDFDEEFFEFVPLSPAGAVSSSANDMAKLLLAYMQNGRLGEARIFSEETAIRMRQPLFRHADAMNPGLHGFMDMSQDGETIIGHGGDTFWFHTLFALLPDRDVGVYVSYNTDTGGGGRGPFLEAFLERYFPPAEALEIEPAEGAAERLEKYAGAYRVNRYPHSDFTKVAAALGALRIDVTETGTLKIRDSGSTEFVETGPGTFRAADGHNTMAFRDSADGEVEWMFLGAFQIVAFERLRGAARPGVQLAFAGTSAAIFVFAALFWPITAVTRWRFGATPPQERRLPLWGRLIGWAGAVMFLAFAGSLSGIANDPNAVALGDLGGARLSLTLGVIAALFGACTVIFAVTFWLRKNGGLVTRLVYTAVAVAGVAAIWQMNYWNLLGFRL